MFQWLFGKKEKRPATVSQLRRTESSDAGYVAPSDDLLNPLNLSSPLNPVYDSGNSYDSSPSDSGGSDCSSSDGGGSDGGGGGCD